MWIPRPVYEGIPYASVLTGFGMVVAAFLRRSLPHGLLLAGGGVLITLGLILWMRRRDYRRNLASYDRTALDD
jgi:hypothetical protein